MLEAILDDIVDPAIGIIKRLYELPREPGSPDLFHYAAEAANTAAFGFSSNFRHAGGASASRRGAIAKAVGEAIERYCAAIYDPDEMPLTTAGAGALSCIAPASFALYIPPQYALAGFPWKPFDDKTPLRWTHVVNMNTGHVAYAPATFVWIPYENMPDETAIGQPISTGLACHDTPDKAALSALCEVIERDAFTIFWQARISPPRIRFETLPLANRNLLERFERIGDAVYLFDLTTDVRVATVLSVLRSASTDRPAHVFAGATSADPASAVTKALDELDHTRRGVQHMMGFVSVPSPNDEFIGVRLPSHHLVLAADHAYADQFNFVFQSQKWIDFNELPSLVGPCPQRDLAAVLGALNAVGLTAYIADLTSPDVRDLGLTVVRALVPGMHPLCVGHFIRARGGRRLYEVPQKLGYRGFAYGEPDNPFPHPYP